MVYTCYALHNFIRQYAPSSGKVDIYELTTEESDIEEEREEVAKYHNITSAIMDKFRSELAVEI